MTGQPNPAGEKGLAALQSALTVAQVELARARGEIERLTAAERAAVDRCRALNAALTPTAATKHAYIGEVKFAVSTGFDEDGGEVWQDITIPWTATKDIMAMILGYAAMIEGEHG